MSEAAKDRAGKYIAMTEEALDSLKPGSGSADAARHGRDILDTAARYLSDSKYFYGRGDFIAALSTVNYAHGWLDAGKKVGLLREAKGKT